MCSVNKVFKSSSCGVSIWFSFSDYTWGQEVTFKEKRSSAMIDVLLVNDNFKKYKKIP